ncbi:fimbrial biogenesis chaperone [Myxococcus landrumensis]|uniref:Molecular chaperone n=1 Tax=Myxococcus landrumensis TaxID=2813577 RepID=A0ABX7NFU7_9BACT|nr:fimbria/pilus periplasmic chaperone [Myxococcus landrumus]QSQ17711.1 molecular chaperone [Myxococcus landrumus]
MRLCLSTWARCLGLAALLSTALPGAGLAATVEVNPIRVELEGGAKGVVVTVRNQGTETTRFQASVHTWTQDDGGRMTLQPTQEVFFFPAMLTLEPGESRPIRVGISSAARNTERSFRLIVEELPPVGPLPPSMGLKILTRVSIPVFVAPTRRDVQARVEEVDLRDAHVLFRVRNPGTVNFFIRQARVRALDAQGQRVVEKEEPGWYVLPGDSRAFALATSAEHCQKIRSLEIEVETDQGVYRQNAPVGLRESCGVPVVP